MIISEKPIKSAVVATIVISVFLYLTLDKENSTAVQFQLTGDLKPRATRSPRYIQSFICNPCKGPSVHAATLVDSPTNGLSAYWWGGSREGGKDVKIFQSHWNPGKRTWQETKPIISVESARSGIGYIKKLGNVVGIEDNAGLRSLFYVSVSLGGWSGSALNMVQSQDGGKSWSEPKRLVTSPFFNVSTLVRTRPFFYEDGDFGIPAYHEFVGKFAEILRVNAQGEVVGKFRVSKGRRALQPAIAISNTQSAETYMRNSVRGGQVLRSITEDGGTSWTTPQDTNVPNPDSAVAVLRHRSGYTLMVANDLHKSRGRLSLLASRDGAQWARVYVLEESAEGVKGSYSYPSIIRGHRGIYHIVYTWNRQGIRHIWFNDSWLEKRLENLS